MAFPCSFCGRGFRSQHAREEHEMIHKGERAVCTTCYLTFSNTDNLRRHDRNIHEPERQRAAESHERRLARDADRAAQRAVMDQRMAALQAKNCKDDCGTINKIFQNKSEILFNINRMFGDYLNDVLFKQ